MDDWLSSLEEAARADVFCARFRGHAHEARPAGKVWVHYDPRADRFSYTLNCVPRHRRQIEHLAA